MCVASGGVILWAAYAVLNSTNSLDSMQLFGVSFPYSSVLGNLLGIGGVFVLIGSILSFLGNTGATALRGGGALTVAITIVFISISSMLRSGRVEIAAWTGLAAGVFATIFGRMELLRAQRAELHPIKSD